MGKKGKQGGNKAAVKAAKKQKQAKKVEQKAKKKQGADAGGEEDLLVTLEEFRKKWEEDHKVTEDLVDGPPSRRANASLTADPVNPYLWLFGGEFFDGTNAYFYNDFYRYTPERNEWRRFSSPTFPGPRSAHQMVGTPAGGGKLWLFGGEFASLNQTSFHHYRDLWCFDLSTSSWERIETKTKPSARSGHRMTVWKQWIILFGGFHDAGVRTNYLNDLWIFDTLEYRWHQCVTKETERWPSARSGFSLLSATEGVILHGGYCKKYTTKTKFEGVPLDDTYFLRLDPAGDWTKLKWEKRKRVGQVPSLRSGATMTTWANKQMGIGFGGVKDVEDEESLTSEFYQDLFGYQLTGNGRWVSLRLRKKKKQGGKRKPKVVQTKPTSADEASSSSSEDELDEEDRAEEDRLKREEAAREAAREAKRPRPVENGAPLEDDDDPEKTIPMQRYNAMLAVLRNTLYIYGGIWETADDESGGRDYTLQSFFSLALDKMDHFVCLRDDDIQEHEWNESESSSDEDDDDGSDSGSSSESEDGQADASGLQDAADPSTGTAPVAGDASVEDVEEEKTALRQQAEAFMGVSKQTERSEEDVMSTPLPGETLTTFYNRTKQHWAQKAHESSDQRGKLLRREGFSYAEDRYQEYKPLLEEIERIQAEAGIEAADVQRRIGPGTSGVGIDSRNRR